MKLAVTLLVRDEIDIIESILEYYFSEGVDTILVTDNGSVDGTRELLESYADRRRLWLFEEPPADFSQHRWVTRMARLACREHAADWVINCDADEFFVWRPGRLKDAFARIPPEVTHFFARRHDFIPFEGRDLTRSIPVGMIYRKARSLNLAGQPLAPKVIHRGREDVVLTQGNHRVSFAGSLELKGSGPIEVFHYPIRSLRQFESKVRNAGSGYAINRELTGGQGFHKRYWYQLLQEGRLTHDYTTKRFFGRDQLRSALQAGELIEDKALANRMQGRQN